MSDIFKTGDLSPGSSTGITSPGLPSEGPGNPDTGDLRRKYNFGDRVSELSIAQDPFFRFLSKVSKKPTDDPNFKFTEKRHSFHKRYAYVTAHATTVAVGTVASAVTASDIEVDDTYFFKMEADYKNSGNITSIYGNTNSQVLVGSAGTLPSFFMKNQVVKINFRSAAPTVSDYSANDYILIRVMNTTVSGQAQIVEGKVVKTLNTATNNHLCSMKTTSAAHTGETFAGVVSDFSQQGLEPKKCYVVGNAHEEGSGYPETWKDQPYSTDKLKSGKLQWQ
mgnify:FL=1